ncbi:MAG: response regulator [Desulfuromonadales bacterium]|nr:response regulator [Desulfuromonadales bacterium]
MARGAHYSRPPLVGGIGFGTHLVGRKSASLYRKTLELEGEVAERKKMEELLRDAKSAAEGASIAKSQFLANMSHEIRTPMNGVLGMAQLLELTSLTPEQREYTGAIKLSGNNLMSLINDILDLSRIEAGKVEIVASPFSLQQCIRDSLLMQRSVIFEKGLKLHVAMAEDLPPVVLGDQLRIKQILLNLLGNAVKFTSEGSIQLSAQLVEQHGRSILVQLAVRDSGIGIAPEAFENIFQPFIQEDCSTTRRFGGTGLGLTISRRLAGLMGGPISVDSTPGVGSCFTLTLPFSIDTTTLQAPPDASAMSEFSWEGPSLRILYAEDDAINITFATALLSKLGHDLVVVNNGRECLAALQDSRFDLVLMDIQMPVMNGRETLREIRQQERESGWRQPVIAVTAHAMRGDQAGFLSEGFDGYVAKPLMTNDLQAEMKRVVKIETEIGHG